MEFTQYLVTVNGITDEILRASELDILQINEQEKQIISAFCFGALNGYSLENQISTVQIQSAMIAILVQKLQYDPSTAAQFCDYLIRCTDKKYHPTMYTIIHRGVEGYYQIGDMDKLRENITEIIDKVKKYNDK
jgi:hypothetical protein